MKKVLFGLAILMAMGTSVSASNSSYCYKYCYDKCSNYKIRYDNL